MRSYEQISGAKTMGFFRWEDDDDRRPRRVTKSRLEPMRSSAPARSRNNVRAARAPAPRVGQPQHPDKEARSSRPAP